MSKRTFRIPRLTAAVLFLGGGSGCGDNDGEDRDDGGAGDIWTENGDGDFRGGAGVNVSEGRIANVSEAYCLEYAECYAQDFADRFDDQDACLDARTGYFEDLLLNDGEDCADAELDVVECESALDCTASTSKACDEQYEVLDRACASEDAKRSLKKRRLRIPRSKP